MKQSFGIANQLTYKAKRRPVFIKQSSPSLTVPDMSISLREMVARHESGGRVKVFRPEYVAEDSLIPIDFERLDLQDRVELSRKTADFIATTRGRMQTLRMQREQEARERQQYEALKAKYEVEQGPAEGSAEAVKQI